MDIGHDFDFEHIYIYAIYKGKFVFVKSRGKHFTHDDYYGWDSSNLNTKGRIDTIKNEASMYQFYRSALQQRKLEEYERRIAEEGIRENFGNDIKIHYF